MCSLLDGWSIRSVLRGRVVGALSVGGHGALTVCVTVCGARNASSCIILHHLASSCLVHLASSWSSAPSLMSINLLSLSPPPHYSLTLVMSCTSPYKLQTNSRSKSRRSRRKKTPPPHPAPPEHCSGCTWTAATRLVHAWFTWFTHASRACFLFAAHALVAPFLLP